MRKSSLELGDLSVQHLWADKASLYDTRPKQAHNARAIIECFWAICLEEGAASDPDQQETYLLARLLPFSAQKSARRVVPDASFGPPTARAYQQVERTAIDELEQALTKSARQALTFLEFRDQTADVLGLPRLGPAEDQKYEEVFEQVFGRAKRILIRSPDAAVETMVETWGDFQRKWSKRGRQSRPPEKTVLDVLSYECRASFHRCYTEVWHRLLGDGGPLRERFDLSSSDLAFLRLWHLEPVCRSNEPQMNFHLFKGHIFGLHPALSLLIRTPTGQEILSQHAALAPSMADERPWGPLLHAAYLALQVYCRHREDVATARRKVGALLGPADLDRGMADPKPTQRKPDKHGAKKRRAPASADADDTRQAFADYARKEQIICGQCKGRPLMTYVTHKTDSVRETAPAVVQWACPMCGRSLETKMPPPSCHRRAAGS